MRKQRNHSHPCRHCGTPVECWGNWERNYDGAPEVICTDYHLPSGVLAYLTCESCEAAHQRELAAQEAEG